MKKKGKEKKDTLYNMGDKGTLKKEVEKVGGEGEDDTKAKITPSVLYHQYSAAQHNNNPPTYHSS